MSAEKPYPYLNDLERQYVTKEFMRAAVPGRIATRAFADEVVKGGIGWMEAFAVTDGQWVVLKKEKSAAEPDKVGQIVVSRGQGFFDAMHALAQFETTKRAEGVPEIETAPHAHYKDAAIRWGLVFDAGGLPHPTAGGQIIGDSFFPEDVYRQAEEYATARRAAAFGPVQKFVAAPEFGKGKIYFDEVHGLNDLAEDMAHVGRILVSVLDDGSKRRASLYGNREITVGELLEKQIVAVRAKVAKMVATDGLKEALAPEVLNWLSQTVTAHGYFARLRMAQKMFHSEKPAPGTGDANVLTKTIQKAAADLAVLTGATAEDAAKAVQLKVVDYKLDRYAWKYEAPPEMDGLLKWVNDLGADLIARSRQAAHPQVSPSGVQAPRPFY